jgi:hypothetical protein
MVEWFNVGKKIDKKVKLKKSECKRNRNYYVYQYCRRDTTRVNFTNTGKVWEWVLV